MKTTFQTTKAAALLFDNDPHAGDPAGLETYFSTDGQDELACTTGEREEWEADSGLDVDSDTLDADTFASLRAYLVENAGLCDANGANRRFVWAVGAYSETFPDMPANLGDSEGGALVLWDRVKRKAVCTLAPGYAQLMVLERTDTPNGAPLSALESWLNSMSADTLASEGIGS